MKPGGLVEPGVMYYGKKIPLTEEQQKIAEALAEKKGTTVDQLHRNIRSKIRKEKITLERAKLPHQSLKQYKTNLSAKKEAAQDIYGISYDEVIADTNKKRRRQRMNRIQERIVDGQYVKAMPAAEQGKKAAEAALKASKEKFFNSDQGKQLKWIADNGKNYSSPEIMVKDFKKEFKVKDLKNAALFKNAPYSPSKKTSSIGLSLLKNEKNTILGRKSGPTASEFTYSAGKENELFKTSILQNNERVKNTLPEIFSSIAKDYEKLKRESRLLGVDDALKTLNKEEYRILRDFGFIDRGIGGGIVKKTLLDQGITPEQFFQFSEVRFPVQHTRNIIRSLKFASSRKQYGLSAEDADKIIKGWKRVSLGFDDANYWIKGVDKFLGDDKFKQIFGKTTFDHVLAKELGKTYYKLNLPKDLLLKGKYTTSAFNQLKLRLYDKPLITLVEKYNDATGENKKKIAQQIDNLHKEFNARTNNYLKDFTPDFTKGKSFTFSKVPFSEIGKYEKTGAAAQEVKTAALEMRDIGQAAGKYEYSKGQIESIKNFQLKQNKFKNLLQEKLITLDDASKKNLGKIMGCFSEGGRVLLSNGGNVSKCLEKKLKQNPKLFLQNVGQVAAKTRSANILNFLKTGRNIARGTGIFAMWEAAFAPIIIGWMGSEGESLDRMKHELAYGPILEAIGVSPDFVPGISEKEEKIKYYGQSGYNLSRIDEIGEEYAYLQAQRDAEINKWAHIEGFEGTKMRHLENKMKELEDEHSQIAGTFYEGPAGQHFGKEKVRQAIQDKDLGEFDLMLDKEARKKEGYGGIFADQLDPTEEMLGLKAGGRVYYDTYLPDPDNDDK